MCGASLPAHGLCRLCAPRPHPHNCLCRWRFWLSCLERRGRSTIPKHTHGNTYTGNTHTHTHTHQDAPSCKAPAAQPSAPGAHAEWWGWAGGGAEWRWQGQEEGAAQRKTEGAKQTRSQADISQPVNFLQFCFPSSERSCFLPVHSHPPACIVQLVSREEGGPEEKLGDSGLPLI